MKTTTPPSFIRWQALVGVDVGPFVAAAITQDHILVTWSRAIFCSDGVRDITKIMHLLGIEPDQLLGRHLS